MTIGDLIDELAIYPLSAPVRIYLEPQMFPDGVDLNELPGEYRIGKIERSPTMDGYGVLIGVEA